MKINLFGAFLGAFFLINSVLAQTKKPQPVYQDKPYLQDYSIKYYTQSTEVQLESACADRNGNISVLSSNGLMIPHNGQFLYPGVFQADKKYRTIGNKKIQGSFLYKDQFVLIDDKAVLSNAWAGSIYCHHELSNANKGVGGKNFDFLITNGHDIHYVSESKTIFKVKLDEKILDIRYQESSDLFWMLNAKGLYKFNPKTNVNLFNIINIIQTILDRITYKIIEKYVYILEYMQ